MKIERKYVAIFMLMLPLGACAQRSGDWPNLSDKLPAPEERDVVDRPVETAAITPASKPPAPPRPAMTGSGTGTVDSDPVPATEAEAGELLETIKKALREETLAYRTAVAKLDGLEGEALQDAWFTAQMALTRLSRTASRLDTLLALEMPALTGAARGEADIIERFVVGERQRLTENAPENAAKNGPEGVPEQH
jgi:hypothetical protein